MTDAVDLMIRECADGGIPQDQLLHLMEYGYVIQPHTVGFHAAARSADLDGGPTAIGAGGARGGGKSHMALAQVAFDDCQRFPGLKVLYLRSVGKSARESFEDFINKIPGLTRHYVPSRLRIQFPNGSRIILGGFRTDSDIAGYLGIEYDLIMIDDAQLVTAERHKQILASLRTSRPGWRPRSYVTFNPGGVGHAYLKTKFILPYRRQSEERTRFFFSLPEDNAFINPEYLVYLETELTGWLKQAWRYGNFDIAAGQFFTPWREDIHVIDPFKVTQDMTFWLSMDHGFVHPTVVLLHAKDGDGHAYTVDEVWARRKAVRTIASQIDKMLERWSLKKDHLDTMVAGADIFAQRSKDPSIADKYVDEGYEWKSANMDRVNGAAEVLNRLGDSEEGVPARWSVFRQCHRTIECLPEMEHDPNRPEDVLKKDADDSGLGGDDPYDALRYGLMTEPVFQGAHAW